MKSNMKKPTVSVCVVTYNHENYIRRCLQSIVEQQTGFNLEVIVGEDCSTDGTRVIVEEFAEKYPELIKPLLHPINVGAYGNYHAVHKMATGDLIAHCDGDDFWYPGKLKRQVNFLIQNPNVAAVFSNAQSGGRLKYKPADCGLYHYEKLLETVFTEFRCVHSSILERRNSANPAYLVEASQFNFEVFDFEWYWLKHRNSIVYIDPVATMEYELSPNGFSRQKDFIFKLQASLKRLEKVGLNESTLEKMRFDYKMLCYFSDPANNERPSVMTALRFGYALGLITRLLAPPDVYFAIKLIRHPELKP